MFFLLFLQPHFPPNKTHGFHCAILHSTVISKEYICYVVLQWNLPRTVNLDGLGKQENQVSEASMLQGQKEQKEEKYSSTVEMLIFDGRPFRNFM